MYHNFTYSSVNRALPDLLRHLQTSGNEVGSRAGKTLELTHVGVTLTNPWRREILVPHRKPSIAAQIAETMWVLSGADEVRWLSHYLPRAEQFSDDGHSWRAAYGRRIRRWPRRDGSTDVVDQLRWVVDLLRKDPASRQGVISIWDPHVDTSPGKDIPCNDWLSFLCRDGYLDLHVAVRSNDVIWGWSGINQFEWSVLLEVVAGLLGMQVGSLHFSTTSFHLYDHHFSKAQRIWEACAQKEPEAPLHDSPRFRANPAADEDPFDWFDWIVGEWFLLEKAIRNGEDVRHTVNLFPEPMLRSWLHVIQWWWTGDRGYLSSLDATALGEATRYSVQPPEREHHVITDGNDEVVRTYRVDPEPTMSSFLTQLCTLHLEKEAAYGGSWKKRGELFSILPNVGRKIDRLGTGGTTEDETSADTAGDLFVYLAKYLTWLDGHANGTPHDYDPSDFASEANAVMWEVEQRVQGRSVPDTEYLKDTLVEMYETLLEKAESKDSSRRAWVSTMLSPAYMLSRTLWEAEQDGPCPHCGGLGCEACHAGYVDEYRGADADDATERGWTHG